MGDEKNVSRYAKQELFAPIGRPGQARLGAARVLVVGCGATGGVLAAMMARAGVGMLRIVDRDFVELSNLQRQVLFDESDAAARVPKAIAAAERLRAINSEIVIEPHVADVCSENILELYRDCDLILDGTDNFETRFLMNDAALALGRPWIYTGVIGGMGQSLAILPGRGGCLRCVMDGPPLAGTVETCDTAGVVGPAVAAVAGLSAATALKLLTSPGEVREPKLQIFDVWGGTLRSVGLTSVRSAGGCAACRDGERRWLQGSGGARSAILCGRNAVQISPERPGSLDLEALAGRLASAGPTTANPYLVRHRTSEPDCEVTIFRDGRAIIQGTEDVSVGRGIYARVVGF